VWCPSCFYVIYREQIKSAFEGFDWRFTRQVVLTVDPARFESGYYAFDFIRNKHSVSEFVRRLRRGVKQKIGSSWVWKFEPINILRWAWFLEWHKNGFPHYHVFIQTDRCGAAGMIGGGFLRDSWNLASWVREEFFRNEEHFKNLTGYYAGKGYFEKGKQYQGILPVEILEKNTKRIKRYGHHEKNQYPERRKQMTEEEIEDRNYQKCITYFDEMANERKDRQEIDEALVRAQSRIEELRHADEKRSHVDYKAMLSRCGQYVYVELDIKEFRFTAICAVDFNSWKKLSNGQFIGNKGYLCNMTIEQVTALLASVQRIVSIKEFMDLKEYLRRRGNQLNKEENYRQNCLMQR
jgi:hypothetical protein